LVFFREKPEHQAHQVLAGARAHGESCLVTQLLDEQLMLSTAALAVQDIQFITKQQGLFRQSKSNSHAWPLRNIAHSKTRRP
jgi:hypothetical protein